MKYISFIFKTTAALFLGIVVSVQSASGAPSKVDTFKRDPAFLYGIGSGATQPLAIEAARADLRAVGLAHSLGGDAKGFYVTDDMKKSVAIPELKPFISEKKEGTFRVVLRLAAADWDAAESVRRDAIRSELGARLTSIKGTPAMGLDARLKACQSIIDRITREGLYSILASPAGGGKTFVGAVEDYCRQVAAGLRFEVDPAGGIIEDGAKFEARLSSEDGLSADGAAIAIEWKAASGASRKASLTVGAGGVAEISFPDDPKLSNQVVLLNLSTALAALVPDSELFRSLDGPSAASFRFRHFDDFEKAFFDMALVPGGSFTAGALPQDRKAGKKEAPRAAQVDDFLIDRNLVTNVLYRTYLEDTDAPASQYPAYIDNPDYGAPDQPVIGVGPEDARRFAEWLSGRTGKMKRLPTEDEWERAARGGEDVVYPWGDQSPAPAVLANYNGNGRFDGPSPVGSFEGGRNRLGIYDMAGNVWQWTSTPADSAGLGSGFIIKGGSWMDGPTELRISNRKGLDPSEEHSDVGFRLVMEVGNE